MPNRKLRIPLKYVDGVWECTYGGIVPVLPYADAELVIGEEAISDVKFLERMTSKSRFKVLNQGTQLLVGLRLKEHSLPGKNALTHLIRYEDLRSQIAPDFSEEWSPATHFLPIYLDEPDEDQARLFQTDAGGLWLLTQGPQAIGLVSSKIKLPENISPEPVASLNHDYTILSETFEKWRISHTGNIYTRVLYKEKNQKWYPLDVLRNAALDKNEMKIANALWLDFLGKMTGSMGA